MAIFAGFTTTNRINSGDLLVSPALPSSSQRIVDLPFLVGEAVIARVFRAVLAVARLGPEDLAEVGRHVPVLRGDLDVGEDVAVPQRRDLPADGLEVVLVAGFPAGGVVPV